VFSDDGQSKDFRARRRRARALIEAVATQERRTVSNVVRNALLDWRRNSRLPAVDATERRA